MKKETRNILEVIKYITPFIIVLISTIFINVLNITDYVTIKEIYFLPLLVWGFIFFVTLPEIK